jgi:hypothetical protein
MRIYLPCMKCHAEGVQSEIAAAELENSGLYKLTCARGHDSVTLLQAHKFEVLFELAVYAIVDGYYRDAVSSFTSALERFFEFYIDVQSHKLGIDATEFTRAWKLVAKQSERQLGAFIFTYLCATKKPPEMLSGASVEFRNNVIHAGQIPSREEAIKYGEQVAEVLTPILGELRIHDEAQVQQAVVRHILRLRSQTTNPNIATMAIGTFISLSRPQSEPQPSLRDWIEMLRKQKALRPKSGP